MEDQQQQGYTDNCKADIGNSSCYSDCIGVVDCQLHCPCRTVAVDAGGPWGDVMDVILGLLPVMFLIYVTLKKNPMPTTRSLPLAALMLLWLRLAYFDSDPVLTFASVILGLHEALTPLSIMAGAITLFETMEVTNCLPYMMREMKALTEGHPIAELMLIFAFAMVVEGASGFGTPVALGAPMLVSSGHPALESVVVMLLMNTFATIWGAVGTPIWFGFGSLGLTSDDFLKISQRASVALGISAVILIPVILTIVVPFKLVKQNIVFILASLFVSVGPLVGLAFVNYEFPVLIAGIVGCALIGVFVKCKVGLKPVDSENVVTFDHDTNGKESLENKHKAAHYESPSARPNGEMSIKIEDKEDEDDFPQEDTRIEQNDDTAVRQDFDNFSVDSHQNRLDNARSGQEVDPAASRDADAGSENSHKNRLEPRKSIAEGYIRELLMRTFPIWAVVLLLILTRVDEIRIKENLTKVDPAFEIPFGSYGKLRLSASLVMQLDDILTYPNLNWKYEILFVPFFIPFVVVSLASMALFRKDLDGTGPMYIAKVVVKRLTNPFFALLGALTLVQLMIRYETASPAFIVGSVLADWFKEGFIVISPVLGALGSFFSGSTTVSNLTFGNIQMVAAESIGTSFHAMLALQAVGGSAGNGICLNNIIAAMAVVGLTGVGEGKVLKKTFKYVMAYTTIATVVMLAFYFRF